MDLSIIVVNWNTRDLLIACLHSVQRELEALSGLNIELLVVDNASTDDSVRAIQHAFPWVRLLTNTVNTGFAAANNRAIHASTGAYILLLNPDTVLMPGALQTLLTFMTTRPEAGAAGARLVNPDHSLQISCYPAPTLRREFWHLFHLDWFYPYAHYPMRRWPLDQTQEVDVIQGACLILRREALTQVGLLDEDYFMYSEEVDLCVRIQRAGWHLYWVPTAEVIHYGGQSTRQAALDMFLRLYQGKLIYFRKHRGRPAAMVYKLILVVAALARLACIPLAWLEKAPLRHYHLTMARRYLQLVIALPDL